MEEEKFNVIITGFGPFMGITDNPSDRLVKMIAGEFNARYLGTNINLFHSEILDVCGKSVDDCIERLRKTIEEERKKEHSRFLLLHFGRITDLIFYQKVLMIKCLKACCIWRRTVLTLGALMMRTRCARRRKSMVICRIIWKLRIFCLWNPLLLILIGSVGVPINPNLLLITMLGLTYAIMFSKILKNNFYKLSKLQGFQENGHPIFIHPRITQIVTK